MIRLRYILERGRAHPIFGPILLILLVLLLAMVFLHIAYEGMDAAAGLGAMCVGFATALGLLLTNRLCRCLPEELIGEPTDRAPPRLLETYVGSQTGIRGVLLSIPLRH